MSCVVRRALGYGQERPPKRRIRPWASPTRSRAASRRPRATSPTTRRCAVRAAPRSARARPRTSSRTRRSVRTTRLTRSRTSSGAPSVETPDESGEGYPEEQPDDVAGDEGTKQREGGRDHEGEAGAPDNEDGTATGTPRSAG